MSVKSNRNSNAKKFMKTWYKNNSLAVLDKTVMTVTLLKVDELYNSQQVCLNGGATSSQ